MKKNFFKIVALFLVLGLFSQYPAYANENGGEDDIIEEDEIIEDDEAEEEEISEEENEE